MSRTIFTVVLAAFLGVHVTASILPEPNVFPTTCSVVETPAKPAGCRRVYNFEVVEGNVQGEPVLRSFFSCRRDGFFMCDYNPATAESSNCMLASSPCVSRTGTWDYDFVVDWDGKSLVGFSFFTCMNEVHQCVYDGVSGLSDPRLCQVVLRGPPRAPGDRLGPPGDGLGLVYDFHIRGGHAFYSRGDKGFYRCSYSSDRGMLGQTCVKVVHSPEVDEAPCWYFQSFLTTTLDGRSYFTCKGYNASSDGLYRCDYSSDGQSSNCVLHNEVNQCSGVHSMGLALVKQNAFFSCGASGLHKCEYSFNLCDAAATQCGNGMCCCYDDGSRVCV